MQREVDKYGIQILTLNACVSIFITFSHLEKNN